MTGPSGLPSDGLLLDAKGNGQPSKQTSPTDIASYLWSTLAAEVLDLIDDAEADRRLGATLATLGRMERDHGFFFNLCDVATGARLGVGGDKDHPPRPFLSSVDNAWLAAALMMVRNARPALRKRADALLEPMDLPASPYKIIRPGRSRQARPGHFHGGLLP